MYLKVKVERTLLLDYNLSRKILASDLLAVDQLWYLIEQFLRLLDVAYRQVTACGNIIVCSMTPADYSGVSDIQLPEEEC